MSTYQKCPPEVRAMANAVLCQFETHKPLLDARVSIDFVFAYAKVDEAGEKIGCALTHNGVGALGICRKVSLKDRALGHGDAEISLDGDWWKEATDDERNGLLDHELHHIAVKIDERGLVRDDLGRPVLKMRPHDYDIGWFKVVAARNGEHSIERRQAAQMLCDAGQYFWPEIAIKS